MLKRMSHDKFLSTANRVIGIEAKALQDLAASLDEDFSQAVDLILGAQGRVIVCGMGKSGHVARKIAATFASTGTPAQFVHPAEASHGDLGMMTQGDVALILSHSGETPELADVIAHTKRFSIPLVGVASKRDSTLLNQSDVALVLPPAPEACGTGIVPTTSTTMTLALGDALAVALMEHRQFTPENFREFHPGGKLGARLLKVSDLMHSGDGLPLVKPQTPMSEVLIEMTRKGLGVAGVEGSDGTLSGIITDGDLRRNMDGLLDRSADYVMTTNPITIEPTALAAEAVGAMNKRQITCLFVTSNSKPIGILKIQDCMRAGVV